MKILVLNGPNLNMLGVREPEIYGKESYKDLVKKIKSYAKQKGVKTEVYQSNCEGELVSKIQKAYKKMDGIVINPGAFTHTSIALLDDIKTVYIPTIEVHISDPDTREEFRKLSYIREAVAKTINGKGTDGYLEAIDFLLEGK